MESLAKLLFSGRSPRSTGPRPLRLRFNDEEATAGFGRVVRKDADERGKDRCATVTRLTSGGRFSFLGAVRSPAGSFPAGRGVEERFARVSVGRRTRSDVKHCLWAHGNGRTAEIVQHREGVLSTREHLVQLLHHRLEIALHVDRSSVHACDATRGHAATLPAVAVRRWRIARTIA